MSDSDANEATTGDLAIDVTVTWSAANAGNTITSREFSIEILNPPPGTVSSSDSLLLESGDYILLEDGSYILME